ncbi:MAG TPA: hypothetical protein VFX30_09955 [bacterium]|nr:hypothetical protein [bacterium]
MATVIANSALLLGPLALSTTAREIQKTEELSALALGSALLIANPTAASAASAFQVLTQSGVVSHPLFRPANDNQDPLPTDIQGRALLLAKNADAALEGLKKEGEAQTEKTPEDIRAFLEHHQALAADLAALASTPFENSEDAEFVHGRLTALAAGTYDILKNVSKDCGVPELENRARLYTGLRLVVEGDLETAETALSEVEKEFPEAAAVVDRIAGDRMRSRNLMALDLWKLHIEESRLLETGEGHTIGGHALGMITWLATRGEKTGLDRISERWSTEADLVWEVEKRLTSGEAETIRQALKEIRREGPPALRERAAEIVSYGKSFDTEGRLLIENLIHHVSRLKENRAGTVLQAAYDLNLFQHHSETAKAVTAFLAETSREPGVRVAADDQLAKLGGDRTPFEILWDEMRTSGKEADAVDIALIAVGGGMGRMAARPLFGYLVRAGLKEFTAMALAGAVGFAVETNAIWALNTARSAVTGDLSTVLSSENLLKTYKANLLSMTAMKISGRIGSLHGPGLGHAFGLGGMMAGHFANEELGYADRPSGGAKETVIVSAFEYFKFGMACELLQGGPLVEKPATAESFEPQSSLRLLESAPSLGKGLRLPDGETPRAYLERLLKPDVSEENWRRIESLLLSSDASAEATIREIRTALSREMGGAYEDMGAVSRSIDRIMAERGVDSGLLTADVMDGKAQRSADPSEFGPTMHALRFLTGTLSLQFLPDEVPVYRTVAPEALSGEGGVLAMSPNTKGLSTWSVGAQGKRIAADYAETADTPTVLVRSTVGELRRAGLIANDNVAVTGNALELHHVDGKSVRVSVAETNPPAGAPALSHAAGLGAVAGPWGLHSFLASQGLPDSAALLASGLVFAAPVAIGMIWGKVMLPGVKAERATAKLSGVRESRSPQSTREIKPATEDFSRIGEEQEQNHWQVKRMEASLTDPTWNRSMEGVADKIEAFHPDVRDFSSQAGFCLWRFSRYEALFRVYQSTKNPKDLFALEAHWHTEVLPAIQELTATRFYKLREAYAQKLDEANASLVSLEYALTRLKVDASKTDRSIDFEFRVKDLGDLPLDPNDPLGSLEKFPAGDLVTIQVKATTPDARAKVERALSGRPLLRVEINP